MSSIIKVDTIQNQSGANIISESANTITVGASGDTVTIPSGATLSSSGTVSGNLAMTPAFHARLSADQSYSSLTYTKVNFNTELYDTDSDYDNSTNYRFTPTTAGKYLIYTQVKFEYSNSVNKLFNLHLRKNGSDVAIDTYNEYANDSHPILDLRITTTVDMNGSTDYLEVFCYVETDSGNFGGNSSIDQSFFGGYRIIGA